MSETFILDIGTRVVVGLIMEKQDDKFKVIASSRTEHAERAMYNGQVHNVDEVARAVRRVKSELEEKTGKVYENVAIAAAGRALKTHIATAERTELVPIRWEQENVLALELEAVEKALKEANLANEEYSNSFHCVGYSTVEQWLEDQTITSLVGQRGKRAKVVVVATFLPRTVVDGLLAVLDRVGLAMETLTLEPIAAGLAAIPLNMRRMNLALVDIGAGTSDIALSKNGAFFAYSMVPMAGDEVTEVICNHFLLDFQTGEKVKRALYQGKEYVSFKDFFGEKSKVSRQVILEIIKPAVTRIAENIAKEILRLNTTLPQGVILIGGGSQTPGLGDLLADIIGLARARVGIQISERVTQVLGNGLKGPDNITAIGIGMSAIENKGLRYYTVKVNDMSIPIFELQLTTVAEALLAAGIQPRSFIGRPGAALTYELNGKVEIVKGKVGEPALILVNGATARLDQQVKPNDIIEFKPGIDGEDAVVRVSQVIEKTPGKTIWWNNDLENFEPQVYVNGKLASGDDFIADGSRVVYIENKTLDDFLNQKGVEKQQEIKISINDREYTLKKETTVLVNGQEIKTNCLLNSGDRIVLQEKPIRVCDLNPEFEPLKFTVNGETIVYPPKQLTYYHRGTRLDSEAEISDGMVLRLEGYAQMPILSELLPYTKLNMEHASGARLRMKVDGQEAQFTTPLHPGALIEIEWVSV